MRYLLNMLWSSILVMLCQHGYSQCSITASTINTCGGTSVDFMIENFQANTTYSWDFDGDGQTDATGASVTHEFPSVFSDTTYIITVLNNNMPCGSLDYAVTASPDPAIGVPPGIVLLDGTDLKACNGSNTFDLQIFNASNTYQQNVAYTINWGDGSPAEQYDNNTFSNTSTITHTYMGLGYYPIFITAEHENGCVFTRQYTFYNGGNPSVGIAIPGNTVGLCAPATLDFPIINASANPPGTEYRIYINGDEVASYTQATLPDVFTYTFEESSCNQTTSTGNYQNAFDLRIVASNPCNSSTATIEPIEISEPPEPYFEIGAPDQACPGSTFSFNNASTNINEVISGSPASCIEVLNPSWTISGQAGQDWMLVNGNLFNSSQIGVKFMEPGVYTIEMTIVSFACGEFTFSQEITIYEPPEPIAGIDLSAIGSVGNGQCVPVEVPLDASSSDGAASYEWSIAQENGWEVANGGNLDTASTTVTFTEGGTYDLTLSVSNACSTVDWDTIILIPGPPTVLLDPLPDFCETASLSIETSNIAFSGNGSDVSSYVWTFEGGIPASSTEMLPTDIQYSETGNYIVTLTTTNACGSQTIADTFEIQEIVPLELPSIGLTCESVEPFQLNATPGGGSWSGTGVSPQGVFMPNMANVGTNILTYTYGVAACMMEDTVQIEVLPAPSVNAGPDQVVCANNEDVLLEGIPPGGTWVDMDSSDFINNNVFSPSLAGPGIYDLTYILEGANSCIGLDDIVFEVLEVPEIQLTPASFCNIPGSVNLPAAQPTGGSWSGPGVTAPSGLFDPNVAGGPGVYDLSYSLEADNGCTAEAVIDIGVIAPELVEAGPDASLCGSIATYNLAEFATPPGGTWYVDGTALIGSEFSPTATTPGDYMLEYVIGSGNCEVRDTLEIYVLPVPEVEAGPDVAVCAGETVLNLQGASPTGGYWSGPGIEASSPNTFNTNNLPPDTYTITYTVEDPNNGCLNSAEKSVVVHPLPLAAFSLSPTVCTNQPLSVNNQSENAAVFDWEFGNGQQSAVATPVFSFADTGTYTITLTATNSFGCEDMLSQEVQVLGPPTAFFTPNITESCGDASITLDNQSSSDIHTYEWDFGNGTQHNGAMPPSSIEYSANTADQTFIISLNVASACGYDQWQDSILVRAFPEANFGFTVDTGCAPLQIQFTNISFGGSNNYWWDFGNGETATTPIPGPRTYTAPDSTLTYPVTLIVANSCGADTLTQEIVVEPQQVEAFFNTSNTLGCAPFTFDLENFATPGANISWNFGDGNVSNNLQPSHTFSEPGTYLITQYAWNSCDEDSTNITIEVLPAPELDFEVSTNQCTDQSIQFTMEGDGIASTLWYFGNGDSTSTTNPIYTYDEPGTYFIRLIGAGLGTGCSAEVEHPLTIVPAPEADLSFDDNQGCPPLDVQFSSTANATGLYFLWDLGDGGMTVESEPQHRYTEPGNYTPTLTVTDERGCKTLVSNGDIFVYPVPIAAFETLKDKDCGLPMGLQFTDNSSGADALTWNNSGGWTSNQRNPMVSIQQAGNWTTTQIAENTYGCRDTAITTLTVYDKPIADFEIDSYEGCQPLRVTFNNFSQGNRFFWTFGDGNTSEFDEPSHIYVNHGSYNVRLVAAFDNLCYDTLFLPGQVDVFPQPVAAFEWEGEQLNGQPTGLIQFNNLSERATRYFWDFGDNATSEEESPSHRYLENGEWKVQLTAWSDGGCVHDTLVGFSPGTIKGLHVPNAFSPDMGIGETKLFFPKGIGLKEYRLQIFSPYGQLLWESSELQNGEPAEGWNGMLNGEPLPQDVYVWKIQAIFEDETIWKGVEKGSGYTRVGSVTLLR